MQFNAIGYFSLNCYTYIIGLAFCCICFKGQSESLIDTSLFFTFYEKLYNEVSKKSLLDEAFMKLNGHAAIREAHHQHFPHGLIRTYTLMGSGFLSKNNVDSSMYYHRLALAAAEELGETGLLINAHLGYGWTLIYDKSDYEGAIQNFLLAKCLAREIGDTLKIMKATEHLVKIYYLKSDLLKSYENCTELHQLSLHRNDKKGMINDYYMFGSIFSAINLHDKQISIVRKLLKLKEEVKDTSSLYSIHYSAANAYLKKMNFDSAMYYARLNLPLAITAGRYPTCYALIAQIHYESGKLDSARFYYEMMLKMQKSHNTYVDTYEYLNLGKIEFAFGNYQKAQEYYSIAEENITRPSLTTQRNIYGALYEYYNAIKQYNKAFAYLKKYHVLTDSITKFHNSFLVGISVMEKEAQKLENDVTLLTKENELQAISQAKKAQQTKMIYGSTVLGFILTGLGFIRFRNQRNARAKQELLNERLRISRELHDEVGATLSGIAMYTHLAKNHVRDSKLPEAEQSLQVMQRAATEMVSKLSDIVWLINPERDTLSELLDRLAEYARHMTEAKGINVQIDLPEDMSGIQFPMEARRNIYLFCKESINNAVKYSQGSMIRLQVLNTADQFKFCVSDDGIGFDEMTVKKGNGLGNMRQRAEEIGAVFHIESAPNRGARINLQYKFTQ